MQKGTRRRCSTEAHLVQHGAKAAREAAQLSERLLEDGREREEPQSVARRGRVEHNDRELHRFDLPAFSRRISKGPVACDRRDKEKDKQFRTS